jgi:hypothetical protein
MPDILPPDIDLPPPIPDILPPDMEPPPPPILMEPPPLIPPPDMEPPPPMLMEPPPPPMLMDPEPRPIMPAFADAERINNAAPAVAIAFFMSMPSFHWFRFMCLVEMNYKEGFLSEVYECLKGRL